MAIIPGSIPVTGFIAPTDTTDTYAVTDAIYGIDGLRNVIDHTERDNISIDRRRAGMVVGTLNDNTYWRLKNQSWTLGSPADWELFAVGGGTSSSGNLYFIDSSENITVPLYSQYWIYGDLTIAGQLTNYGQVVIADGAMSFGTMSGTFSNYGTLSFITINGTSSQNGASYSFMNSPTVEFSIIGSTVSAQVITSSLTSSHFDSINSATAGYILSVTSTGQFEWIVAAGSGTITSVIPGIGLTGGGNSGPVTLDVNVDNGLSIDTNNNIVLGGTLSQDTFISGNDEYTLQITGLSGSGSNIISAASGAALLRIGESLVELSNYTTKGGVQINTNTTTVGVYENYIGILAADIHTNGLTIDDRSVKISIDNVNIFGVYESSNSQTPTGGDSSSNNLFIVKDSNSKGIVYDNDYTANFTENSLVTKQYVDNLSSSKPSVDDKSISAINTIGDGQFSGATITNTPIDGGYISVYINGMEFVCGDGVSTNVDCYFSGDSGVSARGFSSLNINGGVQSGDELYWNGVYSGTDLSSGWRISLHYSI